MVGQVATGGGNCHVSPEVREGAIAGPGAHPGEVDAKLWRVTYGRVITILSRKWVIGIVQALEHGPRRQYQIRMALDGLQLKVLRETLRTLESEGLVEQVILREETATGVGWALTPKGESLIDPIATIFRWGRDHLELPGSAEAEAEEQPEQHAV